MITVLTGDNSFDIKRAIDQIARDFDGTPEKFDGDELELAQLPDLLQGGTLFASKRLVIVRDLSENKYIWDALPDWLERVSDDVHLVLLESKPDKRTRTYKELQKHVNVKSFMAWGDRDMFVAEGWVSDEAKRQGVTMDKKCAHVLVERIGLDQWQLFHALEKLAVLDEVTVEIIESISVQNPTENVFNLFDAALRGDAVKVHEMIQTLERTEDPYKTMGLLASQAVQLAALSVTDKSSAEVALGMGSHPFVMSKLAPHAKRLGRGSVKKIVTTFADTDHEMKSSATDRWILVERALIKTASL